MNDFDQDRRFGAFLWERRKRLGLQRSDLTKATGIARKRLQDIEYGEGTGATKQECRKLAVVYGLDARDVENRARGTA